MIVILHAHVYVCVWVCVCMREREREREREFTYQWKYEMPEWKCFNLTSLLVSTLSVASDRTQLKLTCDNREVTDLCN
jgi:hypothetical protein